MKDKKCKTKGCENLINGKYSKSGLCSKCSQKKWVGEHKEEVRAYAKKYRKKYYQENKEKELKVNEKYRNNNKVKISKINSKYYKKRKGYHKNKSKEHYEANKEELMKKALERHHKRYKVDEGYRMRRLLGTALGYVIRHYIKTGKIANPMKKYHIDWKGIMKVLIPIPQPRKDYNVDHIIPLYKFDLTDFEQIQLAFAPENHRWLKAEDNLKRDKPNTRKRKYKID